MDVEAGDSCDCETDLEELGSWWVRRRDGGGGGNDELERVFEPGCATNREYSVTQTELDRSPCTNARDLSTCFPLSTCTTNLNAAKNCAPESESECEKNLRIASIVDAGM